MTERAEVAARTTGPWRLVVNERNLPTVIYGADNIHTVCSFHNSYNKHDAPFIVKACNAHDAAMEACRAIVREHEDDEDRAHVDHLCGDCNMGAGPHARSCAYHAAKDALAKGGDA